MENQIRIINTSYHKRMTDSHLAQVNFTAVMPTQLWEQYIEKTSINKQSLGRIRFMEICDSANPAPEGSIRVFGRVSHGYGYDIGQDIAGAIEFSKGVKK